MPCKEMILSGRVQGVGFRYSAQNEARLLGLKGSVKNLRDGRVQIDVQADQDETLHQFINWCKKGPAQARVDDIIISTIPCFTSKDFVIE